jgi:hypothetical protein
LRFKSAHAQSTHCSGVAADVGATESELGEEREETSMNSHEDIDLHELETIERNLSVENPEAAPAAEDFLVASASGFLVVSASGFLIP